LTGTSIHVYLDTDAAQFHIAGLTGGRQMKIFILFLFTGIAIGVLGVASSNGAVAQQGAPALQRPPFAVFPHRAPRIDPQHLKPAMKLSDIPLTQAEAMRVVPRLTLVGPSGVPAHILPTPAVAAARAAAVQGTASGPLIYHAGGSVMNPWVEIYTIFWNPPTLQNGNPTGFSGTYGGPQTLIAAWLPEHGLFNVATQYFQIINNTTTYINNLGGRAGFYVDPSPLPASACNDSHTPGNCITDSQIQSEIQKVMSINGWTGGLNKLFMLFTSVGEGSCFDSSSTSCAYVQYCGYHSYINTNPPIIYSNHPYGDTSVCQVPGTPSPNGDAQADAAASVASHEIMEATTDPLLNAWFDSLGNEIGDLCSYNYGPNTWDNSNANQMYNGWFFELQMEYSNHTSSCVQVGP
jgi:hypothetical protein